MGDTFLVVLILTLGVGSISMLFDLFVLSDWEYSDAVLPIVIFPLLTATVVTSLLWIARLPILG